MSKASKELAIIVAEELKIISEIDAQAFKSEHEGDQTLLASLQNAKLKNLERLKLLCKEVCAKEKDNFDDMHESHKKWIKGQKVHKVDDMLLEQQAIFAAIESFE